MCEGGGGWELRKGRHEVWGDVKLGEVVLLTGVNVLTL